MNTFLITGYPRSRTAWLANFLSYGSSFCHHEPVVHTAVEKLPQLLENTKTETVGISDSTALLYFNDFLTAFPLTKIVLVKRDSQEVVKSLLRLGFDFRSGVSKFEQAFREIEKRHEVLTVPFGALPAAEIWDYCVPGEPVNHMRLQMLENFRVNLLEDVIQSNFESAIDKVIQGEKLF